METLRVRAILESGQVASSDRRLPLDSMLAWAWMTVHHPDLLANANPDADLSVEPELPLERRGAGPLWYWACSFVQADWLRQEIHHWHRRFDDHMERYLDLGRRSGRINAASGRYKQFRMPNPVSVTPELAWYCVGDRREVERLANRITHVGKKRSEGYGAVARWEVEPWPADWSETGSDGQLMRAIPAELREEQPQGSYLEITGFRPPYWHRLRQAPCWAPRGVRAA